MSYFSGALAYSTVGAGTLTTSTGSAAVTVTAHANVVAGDLIALVVYAEGDITAATDAGEGWVCLDCGYNSTDTFGLGLFVCVSGRNGTTRNGLTLPTSMAWTAQNYTYRPLSCLRWDLAGMVGSRNWYNAAASATTGTRPAFQGAGFAPLQLQGIQLAALGYNNGGTTTTVGNITNYTERFDTGQTSPPHGVDLKDKTTLTAVDHHSTLSSTLAVAKTERAGVRGFVPLIANVQSAARTLHGGRLGI
jgi:hypothetical protein